MSNRYDRLAAERLRAQKQDKLVKAVGVPLLIVAAFILVFLCVLLSAWVFQALVWNVGVIGLVAACGGTVAKISYSTAIGGTMLVWWLRGPTSFNTKKKKGD